MANVNLNKLRDLVERGYLTVQKHPEADLLIFNYTAKTQYQGFWNDETLMSRGLITTSDGQILARPFEKFFNIDEYKDKPPNEHFEVYEKLDGSLGILYWVGDEPRITTRGSFLSKQAMKATEILREKYFGVKFDPALTYLFEIIYPENRIVVDYGKTEDLVLLAVRDTETGRELSIKEIDLPFAHVKRLPDTVDISSLRLIKRENEEGFVVRFESGLRLKVKMTEYMRLHRLVTGVTTKVIWELMKSRVGISELLEKVPDEFYGWVKRIHEQLNADFSEREREVMEMTKMAEKLPNRREQALFIKTKANYRGAVFAALDGKDYRKILWDSVRPAISRPYKDEV